MADLVVPRRLTARWVDGEQLWRQSHRVPSTGFDPRTTLNEPNLSLVAWSDVPQVGRVARIRDTPPAATAGAVCAPKLQQRVMRYRCLARFLR